MTAGSFENQKNATQATQKSILVAPDDTPRSHEEKRPVRARNRTLFTAVLTVIQIQ